METEEVATTGLWGILAFIIATIATGVIGGFIVVFIPTINFSILMFAAIIGFVMIFGVLIKKFITR